MSKLIKINDDEYEIVDLGEEFFHRVLLKDSSPFSGIQFQFGEVKLIEENDSLRVKFEFEIFQNPKSHNCGDAFREYIGHILVNNLEELLVYNKYKQG